MAQGGGNGNRQSGNGGGFPGFGGFPDPFANFALGGRGRSLFDMFDNDPFFNDPFFTRPFGSMFGGQGGSLFGVPQGFIANDVYGVNNQNHNNRTAPRAPPPGGYLEDAPNNPPRYQQQRDPIIEELPDSDSDVDADAAPRSSSRPGHQQPIIEHPDDDSLRNGNDHLISLPLCKLALCQCLAVIMAAVPTAFRAHLSLMEGPTALTIRPRQPGGRVQTGL